MPVGNTLRELWNLKRQIANLTRTYATSRTTATRTDLAWKYGLDADTMQASVRQVEAKNWIKYQVMPNALIRG
jgi:hypothetical protein